MRDPNHNLMNNSMFRFSLYALERVLIRTPLHNSVIVQIYFKHVFSPLALYYAEARRLIKKVRTVLFWKDWSKILFFHIRWGPGYFCFLLLLQRLVNRNNKPIEKIVCILVLAELCINNTNHPRTLLSYYVLLTSYFTKSLNYSERHLKYLDFWQI